MLRYYTVQVYSVAIACYLVRTSVLFTMRFSDASFYKVVVVKNLLLLVWSAGETTVKLRTVADDLSQVALKQMKNVVIDPNSAFNLAAMHRIWTPPNLKNLANDSNLAATGPKKVAVGPNSSAIENSWTKLIKPPSNRIKSWSTQI